MVSVDKQGSGEAEDEAPAAVGDEPEASAAPRDADGNDNPDPADTSRTFPLDVSSAGADRLRSTVQTKLSEFMGSYTDDVLAAYVVVLVGHGKQRKQAIADLEAFLGSQSEAFVSWLWDHLTENLNDYAPPATEENEKEHEVVTQEKTQENAAEAEKPNTAKESNDVSEPASQAEKPKRGRSPEPWSRKRRTRTETNEKEASPVKEKEKESADPPPPRLRAPRRLLDIAVRDAVADHAPTKKNADATTKRLRSVVATDHENFSESNGKLKARPTIAKPTKSSPAMLIALKAAAAAAEDVANLANRKPAIKTLSRFSSSVWDRLGGKSDDEQADHQSLREAEHEITEKLEYVHVSRSSSKAAERHLRKGRASAADASYGDEQQQDVQRPAAAQEAAPRKESKRHSVRKDRRQGKPERVSQSEKQKAILLAERRSKPVIAEANHVKAIDVPEGKDQDVSEMKKRMRQVELEVSKLRTKQVEATKPAVVAANPPSVAPAAQSSSQDLDSRTITVSNVHLSTTKEALSAHFASCGEVVKATILTDAAGKPKGSAHLEFVSKEAADKALAMNDSNLQSRALKVTRKDANAAAAAAEASTSATTPRPPAPAPAPPVMMRPVRMPIRAFPRAAAAAFMRGSPYSLRPPPPRLLRPTFPVSAPHLQWKRDGATSTPSSTKNGFRSNVGPIRKRSLSYVRPVVPSIPDASAAALPASAEEQKG